MGVVNVTPDSFSDGGDYADPQHAIAAARTMVARGADLIDLGAESTRPGSQPVPPAVQVERLAPVVRALVEGGLAAPLTIDTMSAEVADAMLRAGAAAINDISAGLADPQMLDTVARFEAGYIAMHMQGTPATMQLNPQYADVVGEVCDFLVQRLAAARAAGIRAERLVADPGIGFGKTLQHNLKLLRETRQIRQRVGVPLLVGTSRKGFIGKITGKAAAKDRVLGTAATVAWAAAHGADIVRVHDVGEMKDVVRMIHAIASST